MGHLAPKGHRQARFNSIAIDGLHYCESHRFVFDPDDEERKLYDARPCIYTDGRYAESPHNYFGKCYLYWDRRSAISLKSCIRRVRCVCNIPSGTIVKFRTSWYYPGLKIDTGFEFRVRSSARFEPEYEINMPKFEKLFTSDDWSNELTVALRASGFLVSVYPNRSFLMGMLNTVVNYVGGEFVDSSIPGEIAIAYGHGKKVGFSSNGHDFQGYQNGIDSVLWDCYGEFDKWSRCNVIPKSTPIPEIVDRLRSK